MQISQIWNVDKVPFAAELALEFLMINKYNFDKVYNLIRLKHSKFKDFILGIF